MVKVKIIPLNKTIKIEPGTNLGNALQDYGLELPCGGQGTCGKCKVKIVKGNLGNKTVDKKFLTEVELAKGWRLACQHTVKNDITVEVEQWELGIEYNSSQSSLDSVHNYGIAIDAGSTTIAGQLVDLDSGNILRTEVAYNKQKKYGADIMTRISYALENGNDKLKTALLKSIESVIKKLSNNINGDVKQINIVGNTFIHHVFANLDLQPLVTIPYQAASLDEYITKPGDLGWTVAGNPKITFLPNLGGFVGSDILAGIMSTGMHEEGNNFLLLDIGTNGEIVLAKQGRLYFTSTAAGPAFEGGKIRMGMRADRGAIVHAKCQDNKIVAEVKNNTKARGICGSGLLDAVACGIEIGKIDLSGKIKAAKEIIIQNPVKIYQKDIRELQLAKGAIAAGIDILLQQSGLNFDQLDKIYLAGAFGNYMRTESAIRIGLIKTQSSKIESSGNTALKGAVLSLLNQDYKSISEISHKVDLKSVSEFQNLYIENMHFPKG